MGGGGRAFKCLVAYKQHKNIFRTSFRIRYMLRLTHSVLSKYVFIIHCNFQKCLHTINYYTES